MKITNGAFVRKSLAVFSAAISLIAFISCGEDTGLGSTIDTEAPKIAISYPNPKVSNVARDEFVLAGTCSDDKLISRVQVAVTNLDTQTNYGTFPATLDAKSNTWSVKLNTFDASNEDNCNGYPFPDGNYKFVATAYDNAGHSTQDTSSFEIDNTAPVVVLKSPGSVTTATEYGSSFYVEGTIAEEHTVSSLKVTIYDEAGNVLDQTDVTPYIESDIATSGGTNVSFMKFSTGSSTLRERYKNIYGENKDGVTRAYTCAIYVSDNAKEFKNPGESSNTSGGNETPVFYLYSDVYKSLMSSNGYGLSASDLMRIINGTYTASDDSARSASGGEGGLTSEQLAEVKAILAREGQSGYDAEKSKATDTSEKHLKFSLNPKVNPTYTISGLSIDSSAGSYPSGNKGQTLTFILSPGLDGTLIEAATVKAWLLKCRSQEEGLSEEDYTEFLSDPANYNGATKILDLSASEKYNSDTMLSSLTSTFKLPEITANYFYIVAISGVDADGNELIPDGTFGFIGALSGTPPKVTIETPAKQAIIGSSADITFSGSVVTTDVELESIDISFDVTNLSDGTSLTTSESAIKLVASGSGKEGDSVTWSEPEYNSSTSKYTYTWTCNLRDCDNYELFSAEKGRGKIYSYTATVKATDISGNYGEGSSMVTADTLPPVITVSSLLPSVSDYTDENHTDENVVYVNGNITISGTIYDDNLKTAYYTVLVNGKTVKDEAGNDDEEFTKVTIPNTQFKINVDTTKLEDDSKFDILIYAEDRANSSSTSTITTELSDEEGTGNNTSVNVSETDLYDDGVSLRILQETDRPVISTTNADSSITDYDGIIAAVKAASALSTNIFSAGGKLNATVSDDDGIESVIVEYSSDGSDYKELSSKYSASNNTLSAELPSVYGEYHIRITAKDKKGLEFGSAVSEFYIAVDDGIPTFSGVQPTDGNYYNAGFTVSGSVKDASGQVSLKLKDELNGSLDNAEGDGGTSASVSGNSGVKTGAKFEDTVKVPSESGTYTLTYIASDKYLQESEYSISYTVDKDKPILSDFAGFENGGNLGTKAPPISVKASDDLSGLAKVSVYDGNGTEIAQLSGVGSLYQGNVSLSEGKNSICVKAFDKAGNDARLPESGFFTVTVDTVAPAIESPSLSITEINAENYGSADFDGVTVTATVTDGGSGAKYAWLSTSSGETSYSESASAIKAENNNSDLTAEWNVSLLIPKAAFSDDSGARDGQYTYYLYAEDAAPKASVSSALTFVVDTTAPEFTVSVLKDGKRSFTQNDVSDLNESKTRAKYSLSGSWKDLQTGTASLQYATSATPAEDDWEEISNTAAANIALSWNATIDVRESQGNSLSFRARDKAGNVSAVTTYSGLIFDFSAPSITLNSTIPSQTREPVTVAGSVSDSLAVSKEKIIVKAVKGSSELSADVSEVTEKEGKEYSYSLEIPATEENNGSWTISFEATDEAGQKTTLPSKTVTLDTSVPTLSYDWSTSPATASGSSFDSGNKTVYFNGSKTLTVNITVKDNDGGVGLSVVEYNILSDRKTEWAEDGALNSSWSSLSKVGSSDVWKATIISDFAALSDGDYTVFIRSSDELGNEAYAEPLYLVSDKTSPVLSETVASGKAISSAGLSYEAGNFSLSGIITDANLASLEYTLDGRVPQVLATVGDAWSIENDSVADEGGSFAYVLTATDKAGNTAKLIRTVIIDKTAPELSLDAWKNSDGDEINNKNSGTVTFSGSVSDESDGSGLDSVKVWYTSNSEKVEASVSPDSDGKWTYTFTNVAEGSYTIYALAKDKAGNEKQVDMNFGVDLTKPESSLMVTGTVYDKSSGSPVPLSEASDHSGKWDDGINYLAKEAFTLSGIISDEAFMAKNVRLTVKKDGGAETSLLSSTNAEKLTSYEWSYTQTVASDHSSDGLYTYKLSVTDDAGNAASYSFIVRVDTTAPTVNITSPASGANFKYGESGKADISIAGTAFDNGSGAYKVYYDILQDGSSILLSSENEADFEDGSWKDEDGISIDQQGSLTLLVTAEDYLGNKASGSLDFVCDSLPPVIKEGSIALSETPSNGYYKNASQTLSLYAKDAVSEISSITAILDTDEDNIVSLSKATPVTVDEEGYTLYTGRITLAAEGTNKISITATDKVSNSQTSSDLLSVVYDANVPVISMTESDSITKSAVTISGSVSDSIALAASGITVTATNEKYNGTALTATTEEVEAGKNYSFIITIPAANLYDGEWTVSVSASDVAGRQALPKSMSFVLDTTPPVLKDPLASADSSSVYGAKTYFNSTKPLTLSVSASDSSENGYVGSVSNVHYAVFSGNLSEIPETEPFIAWAALTPRNATYTVSVSDMIDADDGEYTVFLKASDSADNSSTLSIIHLVADKTAPSFEVTSDSGKSIKTTDGVGKYFETGSVEGFTIFGTLSEANLSSLTYTLNGGEAQPLGLTGSSWSISSGDTSGGGTFAYEITATDRAGSKNTVKRTVTIDKIAPSVTVDDWKDGDTVIDKTKNSTVTFSGSLKDDDNGSGIKSATIYYMKEGGSTRLASGSLEPDSKGEWKYSFYDVAEGKYKVYIDAEDNAGNQVSFNNGNGKSFGVDSAAPTSSLKVTSTVYDKSSGSPVSLSAESDHKDKWNKGTTYLAKEAFTLSGTVSDVFTFRAKNISLTRKKDGGSEVSLVTSTADDEISTLDWSYTQTVASDNSDDGVYTYKLTTQDDAGNAASYSFIVQVDTSAPTLTIVKPASNANFKPASGTVEISGTAFDDGAGAYQVFYDVIDSSTNKSVVKENEADNDLQAPLENGKWIANVNLTSQGHLALKVKVLDYLENVSDYETVSFFCDSIAPTISAETVTTTKEEGLSYFNTNLIDISAQAIDDVSGVGNITYTLNSGTPKAMSLSAGSDEARKTGTYTASVICSEGENTIVINATDYNGNSTTASGNKTLTVYVDKTAPVFGAVSVSKEESKEDVVISGSISENFGLASTGGLIVSATKDGSAVDSTSLDAAIEAQPSYTSGKNLENSAWNFTLKADSDDHSTDGKWIFTITAKDQAGNTSSTTATVLIDTKAPAWVNSDDNTFKIGGKAYNAENWYKDSTLSVIGFFNEDINGSGIKEITYILENAAQTATLSSGSFDANKSLGIAKFQGEASSFENGALISFTVEDAVGNKSTTSTFPVKVDSTEPEAEMYGVGFNEVDKTNGKVDKTIKFLVFDNESGLKEDAVSFSVGSKKNLNKDSDGVTVSITKITAENEATYKSEYKGSLESLAGYDLLSVSLNAEKYLSGLNGTLGITTSVSDNAGNSWSGTVATIEIDSLAPEVAITSAEPTVSASGLVKVNKNVTISGSATDSNTVTEVLVTASGNNVTKYYSIAGGSIEHGSDTIATDETTKVTYNSTTKIWTLILDTTAFYNDAENNNIEIKVIAKDNAGNWTGDGDTNSDSYKAPATKTYNIDQNTDRPLIKITNLTKHGDGYVLKTVDDAHLEGTISDDDSNGTSVVKELYVVAKLTSDTSANYFTEGWDTSESTETVFKASHETYGSVELTLSSGDWTYTPTTDLQADGERSLYFKIVDNKDGEFETKEDSQIERPYWQFKTDSTSKADTETALSYRIDGTSPEVSSVKADSYESDTASEASASDEDVGYTFVVGGENTSKRYVEFKIEAKDDNGIAGIRLSLTQGNTVVSYASNAAVQTSGLPAISGTFGLVADTNNKKSLWTTGRIDMSQFVTGEVTLSIVPVDNCSLTGNERKTFYVDKVGPEINVTAPSESSEQIGSVTLSGTVIDNAGGAGTQSIAFAIPLTGVTDPEAEGIEYAGINSSVADTVFDFVFDGKSNSNPALSDYIVRTSDDATQTYDVTLKEGKVSESTDIWEIPVFLKGIDKLGNISYKTHKITYNPNADMAVTTIGYPSESDYITDTELNAKLAVIGGSIRANGSVSFVDSSASVGAVFVQIGSVVYTDGKPAITWNKALAATDGLTAITSEGVKTLLGTESVTNADENWWGIKAENKAYSWNLELNKNGLLNTTEKIAIRACAVNANGKMGNWSSPVYIKLDSSAPKLSAKLKQFTTEPTGEWSEETAHAEKEYTSGMYLRNPDGNWYIEVLVKDEDNGVDTTKTSVTGANLSKQELSDDTKTAYVYFPVSTSSGETNYGIYVEDVASPSHSAQMSFTVYIDNDAPVMGELQNSNTEGSIAYTKIRNDNYNVSLGASASDSGSGFEKLAYFFKRTVSETTTIELPVKEKNSEGKWLVSENPVVMTLSNTAVSLSASGSAGNNVSRNSDSDDKSGLYGVTLTGATRSKKTTFEHALVSDYVTKGLIRVGGIARIGGFYNKIESVSGDTVTFVNEVSTDYTEAFFSLAFIADNNGESSVWAGGVNTLDNDDGDGIYERVTTNSWISEFCSDGLEDGPISICCTAFDAVENTATQETKVMIANRTPRLTKVFLATDLNGDGNFAQNEFVEGSVYISRSGETTAANANKSYLSSLDTQNESASSVVTVGAVGDWTDSGSISESDPVGTALEKLFRISADSLLTFEFVSGHEGYGEGNGTIVPYMSVGSQALSEADGNESHKLSANLAEIASSTVKYSNAQAYKGISLGTSLFYNNGSKVATYGSYTESTSTADTAQYLSLTLWDQTKGTTVGVTDSDLGTEAAKFGAEYTVLNIPVYFDFIDDSKPVSEILDPTVHSDGGHIELSSTLPSATFKETSGEKDTDTKISGKVVFTGSIKDDKKIANIKLKSSKKIGDELVADKDVTLANFEEGILKVTDAAGATDGWTFVLSETSAAEQFSIADGHKVNWTLTLDSSYVENVAASDVKFTLTASDGTNDANATYQVDIVPYVTGITAASEKLYRSTYGEYSAFKGDSLVVSGYNFSENPTVRMGANKTTAPALSDKTKTSFKMTVPSYSGELYVTVNGMVNLNSMNNNANVNNQEEKTDGSSTVHSYWYDNRYIRVWDNGHFFKDGDADAHKPIMAADYYGNLFGIWTRMGDGQVIVEKTADATGTRVVQHYDQMAEYAAIGIDTKSENTTGAISVLNFNENVGDGGVMSNNGFSAVSNCGGAWGVAIDNNVTVTSPKIHSDVNNKDLPMITIANNPTTFLDSNWGTSGYSLASYAMLRDVGKFSTPRTTRHGNNMHFVYYDSKDQSLRYTWVEAGSHSNEYYDRNKNFTTQSWVLIDGTVNGYDRVHDYSSGTNSNDFVSVGDISATQNGYSTSRGDGYIENRSLYTLLNGKVASRANVGIGITYETENGTRRIFVVDNVYWINGNAQARRVYLPTDKIDEAYAILSDDDKYKNKKLTIYAGAKNVITSDTATQASAAGKFSSLDVTSGGYPVIAYYDGQHGRLRIAYASKTNPTLASDWTRKDVTYTASGKTQPQYATGGSHCAMKIDNSGNVHIIYRDKSNNLMYIKGDSDYNFSAPLLIDDSTTGTWGTISLRNGTTPIVSYLNSEESAEGVKVAILRTVDEGTAFVDDEGNSIANPTAKTTNAFDTMIIPLSDGYNVVGENLVCVEANNGHWDATHTEAGVKVSECEAAVSYQSTRLDLSFLKSEQ
ncbi:Ig-like domain-containing protein [Treponema sp.]|uniref:Ig-like domain-containing protein n=1 Tax=Treponema sp. TaxID=166 RepID=UPI0025EBB26B|nr:Ig-like domain-containing protein [Treponema sp.]MBR4321497.1 hypothetical protein [Treponema sp.]